MTKAAALEVLALDIAFWAASPRTRRVGSVAFGSLYAKAVRWNPGREGRISVEARCKNAPVQRDASAC